MPTRISVRGDIVGDDYAWIYDFFGAPCASPGSIRQQLADADGDDVIVEVNSRGGHTSAGAEIYEAIRSYPGNIEVHVVGMAASAASVVACAARSTITPAGYVLIHRCSTDASGNANDMKQTAQQLSAIDESMMGAYRAKTGMSDTELYRLMDRETVFSAQRAVELGFIDEIAEPVSATATPVSGYEVAASSGMTIDPSAIAPEAIETLRKAYLQSRGAAMGGESMEEEDIETIDAAPTEPVAVEPQEPVAAAPAEPVAVEPQGPVAAEPTYEDGVAAERERIRAIYAMAGNVPADMIARAAFEEPTSAAELAVAFLSQDRSNAASYMAKAKADAEESGSANVAAKPAEAKGDRLAGISAKLAKKF